MPYPMRDLTNNDSYERREHCVLPRQAVRDEGQTESDVERQEFEIIRVRVENGLLGDCRDLEDRERLPVLVVVGLSRGAAGHT